MDSTAGTCSSSLLDVEFINRTTGWACGDGGVIVKTTNGGINWLQQVSGVSNKKPSRYSSC